MWDLGGFRRQVCPPSRPRAFPSPSPRIFTSKTFSLQENLLPILLLPKASLSKLPKVWAGKF